MELKIYNLIIDKIKIDEALFMFLTMNNLRTYILHIKLRLINFLFFGLVSSVYEQEHQLSRMHALGSLMKALPIKLKMEKLKKRVID